MPLPARHPHVPRPARPGLRALLFAGLSLALAAGLAAGAGGSAGATSLTRQDAARSADAETTGEARVARAARSGSGNPLAGHRMGVYKGRADQAWMPYVNAKGTEKRLLGKIALRPKAKWFGAWISNGEIEKKVNQYIASSTGGNPNVLSQMTVFRVKPWEHNACKRLPTKAEQTSYKQWIHRAARAVGNAKMAVILQPDGPFALCAPRGSRVPSQLIAYAARKFSALPRTSVYIDGGASDWPAKHPEKSATILQRAGVRYARGFALNSTHYDLTGSNVAYGTRVVQILASRGIRGKHFVVNTSSNGHGFTFNKARGSHRDNAKVCQTKSERVCVTLGIPPTTNVASTRWGMSPVNRRRAAAHVDAFLWFGRPWLHMQADPFVKSRALAMARTTPW